MTKCYRNFEPRSPGEHQRAPPAAAWATLGRRHRRFLVTGGGRVASSSGGKRRTMMASSASLSEKRRDSAAASTGGAVRVEFLLCWRSRRPGSRAPAGSSTVAWCDQHKRWEVQQELDAFSASWPAASEASARHRKREASPCPTSTK